MTRVGWAIATHAATFGLGLTAFFHPLPKLIWNASASAPIGLYALRFGSARCRSPSWLWCSRLPRSRAPRRAPLPAKGHPMLKRVLALPDQTV